MAEYNDELPMLESWESSDNDGMIIVDGVEYPYEITLSMEVSDEQCCRVKINGKYYYFG